MQLKWAITAYLPLNVDTAPPVSVLLYTWEHISWAKLDCHCGLRRWLYGFPFCVTFCEHTGQLMKVSRTCDSRDWCLFCLQRHADSDGEGLLHCPSGDLHTGGRLVPLATHQQHRRALKLQASPIRLNFKPLFGCEGWNGGEEKVQEFVWEMLEHQMTSTPDSGTVQLCVSAGNQD